MNRLPPSPSSAGENLLIEPACPHFLARASASPAGPIPLSTSLIDPGLPFEGRRVATPIANHPIAGLFDGEGIRNSLQSLLSDIDWSHISVARVGFPGAALWPPTILIGVSPSSAIDSQAAQDILRRAAPLVYW